MELWPPPWQGRANRAPFVDVPASLNAPQHVAPKRAPIHSGLDTIRADLFPSYALQLSFGSRQPAPVRERCGAVSVALCPMSPRRAGGSSSERHSLSSVKRVIADALTRPSEFTLVIRYCLRLPRGDRAGEPPAPSARLPASYLSPIAFDFCLARLGLFDSLNATAVPAVNKATRIITAPNAMKKRPGNRLDTNTLTVFRALIFVVEAVEPTAS